MNIVFAYHNGDAELALLSAKAITSMGINMRHKATVCATEGTALTGEITEELKKSFPEVKRIIAQDGFNGWPLGPNQMFSDAAVQCYSVNEPWMFWEPDCVPMKTGWADDLEAEFRKEPAILGHQYEGGMASNGKNIYKMIVGSAIYPPNFLDFCPSAQSLGNYNLAYRSSGSIPEPWDVRCRWNFLAIGRDCPLLRTYWKSVNYQWKDEKIVFFAEDPEAQAIQGVTCADRIISSQAVVIHGCKDGSLHKMAIAGFPMPEEIVQGINNDAQERTVCDKTSEMMRNSPEVATKKKNTLKRKNNSPSKANKPQEPEEFIKQLRKLADNLKKPAKKKKKKTERPAQDAV